MSNSNHTEVQIIGALKQMEAGRSAAGIGREYGVSKHTIYAWKAKYGGMDVSEAQEVKQLREENARLKKLVADLSLDKDMLQSVIRKLPGLVERRAEARRLTAEFAASERHICELMNIPRSSFRYQSRRDDSILRERLIALAQQKPRFGYRRLHILLQREGEHVNHKRVQRVYRTAGLCVRRIRRKRLTRSYTSSTSLSAPNQEWAIILPAMSRLVAHGYAC